MPHRLKPYGYAWVTLGFFVVSIVGHWLFGWFAYADDQLAHNQPLLLSQYFVEMSRETFENWQSEFLQLLWQVGGLAFFLFLVRRNRRKGPTAWRRRSTPCCGASIRSTASGRSPTSTPPISGGTPTSRTATAESLRTSANSGSAATACRE